MKQFIIPSVIFFLAYFWSGWHYYRDHRKPEPILHLTFTIILGILSVVLAEYLHLIPEKFGYVFKPGPTWDFLFFSIFGIGFIEELCKFIPFIFICTRFKEYNEVMDGFIYSSMIGIGFALEETFFYSEFESNNLILLSRASVSPLTHALFASFMGYFHILSKAKNNKVYIFLGLGLASFTHGIYDFFYLQETYPYPIILDLENI